MESAGVELVLKHVFSLPYQSPVEVRAEQVNTLEREARVWVLGKVLVLVWSQWSKGNFILALGWRLVPPLSLPFIIGSLIRSL